MRSTLLISFLLLSATASQAVRPQGDQFYAAGNGGDQNGGFFGPIGGFIPGFVPGMGGGYGAGFGGPGGGYAKGGTVRGSGVCRQKGPCYGKKLICPAKCYTSFSRSGKGFGYGGGGGGCNFDCKKKCIAYC